MTTLHHIPLADLKVSKLNVRKHGPKDIASLAASIAANGVLQPLVVRAADNGYEIIAGQRRFLAAKSLDTTDPETPDTVPCVVLDRCDDAAAVEASLAENIERLPMDEMDQHEAFMALRRKGLECADIAAHFGITDQVVKRRLALANLILGLLTPPFGLLLFVMKGVAPPDTTMQDIYKAAIPFIACVMLLIGMILVFPPIATWLPKLSH